MIKTGKIVGYDATRGVAEVEFKDGSRSELHALAFFSGRPARLPTPGEYVKAQVKAGHIVAARPITGV